MDSMLKTYQQTSKNKGKQKRSLNTSALGETSQNVSATSDSASSRSKPTPSIAPKPMVAPDLYPPKPNMKGNVPAIVPRQRRPRQSASKPVPEASAENQPSQSVEEHKTRRQAPKPPVAAPTETTAQRDALEAETALLMAMYTVYAAEGPAEGLAEAKAVHVPPPKPARSHTKPKLESSQPSSEELSPEELTIMPEPAEQATPEPIEQEEEYTLKAPTYPGKADLSMDLSHIPFDADVTLSHEDADTTHYDNLTSDGNLHTAPTASFRGRSMTSSSLRRGTSQRQSSSRNRCYSIADAAPAKRMDMQFRTAMQTEPRSPSCSDVSSLADPPIATGNQRARFLAEQSGQMGPPATPSKDADGFTVPKTPRTPRNGIERCIRSGAGGTFQSPLRSYIKKYPVEYSAKRDRVEAQRQLDTQEQIQQRASAFIGASNDPDSRVDSLYTVQVEDIKRQLLTSWLGAKAPVVDASRRTLTLRKLEIPTNFWHMEDMGDAPELVQYCLFVQIQYENQLWISSLKEVTNSVKEAKFEEEITFENVDSNFELELTFYSVRLVHKPIPGTPQEKVKKFFKRAISAVKLAANASPSTKKDKLAGMAFEPVAHTTMKPKHLASSAMQLVVDDSKPSPYSGTLHLVAELGDLTLPKHEGKLTFKDAGEWIRGNAVLQDGYFTFTSDLNASEHTLDFDFASFLPTDEETASKPSIRDCGRKHTFDVVGPARKVDETLHINWRFRADCKEDLDEWIGVINDTAGRMKAWAQRS